MDALERARHLPRDEMSPPHWQFAAYDDEPTQMRSGTIGLI